MFQSLYDSPWLATVAVGAVSLAGFALWLRRRSFLVAFICIFTLVTLGDALRSGIWSPLHLLTSPWEDPIGMGFVLLGDLRYFLLVERFAWQPGARAFDATGWRAWASTIGLTLIVPVLSLGLQKAFPARFADGRWSYLAYEALFIVLVVGLRLLFLRKRLAAAPPAVRAWLLDITHYEIGQYVLWVVADVIILVGVDAGFALRLVPNFLYYGLFVWFVAFRAPPEVEA